MRSYVHWVVSLATAASLSLGAASSSAGQSTGTVRGRVVEVGSRRPISDAQVTITGTAASAVSNALGDFVITIAPSGPREITARRIGYGRQAQNIEIPTGGEVRVEFVLSQTAAQLEQVVVTGTAGVQEKREIGNAVTQLDVADITKKATVTTVGDILQGRTPGVTVSAGSGTPGTSSEITIRGYGSFTNNRPVFYIDGVRMDTEDIGAFNPSGAGTGGFSGQRTSALDLINPQDIESIEVIRGPAAATLYGADAAGGVIQIITKKGTRGQQDLQWTARWENGWNEWGTETITNYTVCSAARKAAVDAASVPLWNGCQGKADNEIITDDPLSRDPGALRDGGVNNLSLSLRGGGDRYSFYISGDGLRNDGVLENNYDKRRSVRTNFTFNPNGATTFNINVGYINQDLRLPLGDEAFNGLLLSAARGIPGRTRPRPALNGWGSIEPSAAHRYNNSAKSDRLLLGTTVNYSPFGWWQNRLTAGMDWRETTAQILSLPGDPDVPAGLNALRDPSSKNYSLDYTASVLAPLPRDLESTTSFGAQLTSRRDEQVNATGSSLPTREITIIGAALSVSGSNSYSEFNSVGAFIQEQIAWRDRVYATLAMRMDDHSSFGTNYDPILYPKASLSWVLSDEPALARYFHAVRAANFRFRGAWGLAGRAPAPYAATQTYGSTRVALSPTVVGGALTPSTFGNPNLKPEKGAEIELGFDSDYFDGRAGLEFTYYNKTLRDLLVPLALPPSLGFSGSMTQNLGKTSNSGVEMGITGRPVDMANFTWDGRLNLSWNRNRLDVLDTVRVCKTWIAGATCPAGKSAAEEIPGGASYSPGMQRNRVGYPLGSYFVRYPTRDANGNYIINRNATTGALTTPVYDTAFKYLGPAVPTKLFSLSNTFTVFKQFQLFGMLDYQGGHYLLNYKEYHRCALATDGPNCARLNRPELIGTARLDTLRAVFGTTGTPTTVSSPMTQTLYVEKADYVKLRDVSLSYAVPATWAQRVRFASASIVLSGRNLALWSDYSGLDPEVNGYSNNQLRGSGNAAQFVRVDAYSWPMIRRYTFAINATY
jgi:TonB-dependent starch-binding outer membrane protein SusC